MNRAAFAFVLAVSSTAVWAQSKKYPSEPVDKDEQEAAKSKLWDQATNPAQVPYQQLVAEAQKLLKENRRDATVDAVAKLDEAVKLMPTEPEAFRLRGDAYMTLQDWAKCSADYDAAWTRVVRDPDAKNTHELRLRLGICQARDGKLADAERTLAEAAATGVNSIEIWMRLGEVRIAMGKLEGAIAALEAALQPTDNALVRYLLAGAYDRARQPSEARKAATDAINADRNMTVLTNPTLPLLGVGEENYLQGLANEALDPPRPELALVHFRRFAKLAADSPWRKRAEDHIRELRTARLPENVERGVGAAPYDVGAMRELVRKHMPAMRACMAKTPFLVLAVVVTRRGPKGPEMVRYRAVPDNVDVQVDRDIALFETTRLEADTAIRCVEPIVQKVAFPKPKEPESYYTLRFRVVGQ